VLLGGDPWRDAVELHRRGGDVARGVALWAGLAGGGGGAPPRRGRGRPGGAPPGERGPCGRAADAHEERAQPPRGLAAKRRGARPWQGPELLRLDEPTAGLDPLMEAAFRECVNDERHDGRTILLSSHILAEAEALADRVTIIRDGRVVETGALAEMRHLARI